MSPDSLKLIVRENVRERRLEQEMTQAEVALAIGTSQAFIANIERGHTSISMEILAKLAEALGTQPSLLLTKDAFKAQTVA